MLNGFGPQMDRAPLQVGVGRKVIGPKGAGAAQRDPWAVVPVPDASARCQCPDQLPLPMTIGLLRVLVLGADTRPDPGLISAYPTSEL